MSMFNLETCKKLARDFNAEVIPCHNPMSFGLTQNEPVTGVHLILPNLWTVSIQWGDGTYTAQRVSDNPSVSEDAEIAAWDRDEKWYDFGEDQVKGYCSVSDVMNFLRKISNSSSLLN